MSRPFEKQGVSIHPPVSALFLIGLIVVLAAVMKALAGGESASPQVVRAGDLSLTYRSPWRVVSDIGVSRGGLHFADPVALRGGDTWLIAGELRDGSSIPGGLPPDFARHLRGRPTTELLRDHAAPVSRYSGTLLRRGVTATLYVVATDRGDFGILCIETVGREPPNGCRAVVETLQIAAAHPVQPGPDPTLARGLSSSLALLSGRGDSALAGARLSARRAHARHLASLDEHAADALEGLTPEVRDRRAVAALATAFDAEAAALKGLAASDRQSSRSEYASARRTLATAGASVVAAAHRLRRIGFREVPLFHALAAPPLPRPHQAGSPASSNSAPAPPAVSQSPSGTESSEGAPSSSEEHQPTSPSPGDHTGRPTERAKPLEPSELD